MSDSAALSYHEPDIVSILILSSFLILLNAINFVLDRTVYCGIIGQILIGVAWGTPGSKWLSLEIQTTATQLGYLGLILIVFEGGLSTDLKTLKANLLLSAIVAFVGIGCPIALSFVLRGLLEITALQAFAAGAALCSTSLGTTFTVLSTSGLTESRLGVVLTSAAMMDDVVGLVMVQVISNLGEASGFDAVTVVRPVMVSIAFAVIVPLVCVWVIKPITIRFLQKHTSTNVGVVGYMRASQEARVSLYILILIAMVTGSTYAGTSNLFAAYLSGAAVSWWNGLCKTTKQQKAPCRQRETQQQQSTKETGSKTEGSPQSVSSTHNNVPNIVRQSIRPENALAELRGVEIYGKYLDPAVRTILKPFFFASIGFSIPISQMFSGGVVWRGFVYAALMVLGKLLCGTCLLRFPIPTALPKSLIRISPPNIKTCFSKRKSGTVSRAQADTTDVSTLAQTQDTSESTKEQPPSSKPKSDAKESDPLSLYPAAILGSAMVARGEIGFLISSVAEGKGIFKTEADTNSSSLFLVVTWAILLCTIIGPLTVGLLVRRVKRLQTAERNGQSGRDDPLGIWAAVPVR